MFQTKQAKYETKEAKIIPSLLVS